MTTDPPRRARSAETAETAQTANDADNLGGQPPSHYEGGEEEALAYSWVV